MALFNYFGLMEVGRIITKDRGYSIELDGEEKMLLNRILNEVSVRAAIRLIETNVNVDQHPLFTFSFSSTNSTWPVFQYDSVDTSQDQYEKSYYISDSKYKKN